MLISILTQILPFLLSPVFSRLYSPVQFGDFSILLSFSSIFIIFFCGKYDLALLLPKYEIDIKSLFRLCVLIIGSCFILTMAGILLLFSIKEVFYLKIEPIYLLVPAFSAMGALSQIISSLILYLKKFKELSNNRFLKSILTVLFTAVIGLISNNFNGLIIGAFVGQIISILLFFRTLRESGRRFQNLFMLRKTKNYGELATNYGHFPKYSLPADVVNAVVGQAPIAILTFFFTKEIVGYYGFVLTVVQMPISIIVSSVQDLFKENSTREFKEFGNCLKAYKKTFLLLLLINLVPMIIILLWGDVLFKTVFGVKWETAGHYAQIMILMFCIKFISSPLSYTFVLANKQKLDLYLHLGMLLLLGIAALLGAWLKLSETSFLEMFALAFASIYLFYLVKSYKFSKGNVKEIN